MDLYDALILLDQATREKAERRSSPRPGAGQLRLASRRWWAPATQNVHVLDHAENLAWFKPALQFGARAERHFLAHVERRQ